MIDLSALRAWADATLTNARLGIAVSGGGDSLALLRLLAVDLGRPAEVATVDHGLREGSAQEAAGVAKFCADLGLSHATLTVDLLAGPNLQARARDARFAALADWAKDRGLSQVALGHTQDDQAETFLLRLARGSGVVGLAAMAPVAHHHGVTWLRPLLGTSRADLREYLRSSGTQWIDDPSNEDPSFARIRLRQAAPDLAALGLTPDNLGATAHRMAGSAQALDWLVDRAWAACGQTVLGCASLDLGALADFPVDTQTRLFAQLIQGIGGAIYPPRFDSLRAFMDHAQGATLGGVQSHRDGVHLWLFREPVAVQDVHAVGAAPWDGRWNYDGADPSQTVAALGPQGQAALRSSLPDLPFAARCSLPGLWQGDALLAGPGQAALIRPVRHSSFGH